MFRMLFVITTLVALVSGKPDDNHDLPNQPPDFNKPSSTGGETLSNKAPREISNTMRGADRKTPEITNTDEIKEQQEIEKTDIINKKENTNLVDIALKHELGQDIKQQLPFAGSAVEVAFEAITLQDRQLQGVQETVIFETVQFNIGGGYNLVSGEFTVPMGGIYLVHWAVRSKSSYMWFKLTNGADVISDMTISNYYSLTHVETAGISDSRLVSLNAGDILKVIGCGKDYPTCEPDANTLCSKVGCAFGAILIYPLSG